MQDAGDLEDLGEFALAGRRTAEGDAALAMGVGPSPEGQTTATSRMVGMAERKKVSPRWPMVDPISGRLTEGGTVTLRRIVLMPSLTHDPRRWRAAELASCCSASLAVLFESLAGCILE